MKRAKQIMLEVVILFLFAIQSQAQVFDEWAARPNVSLKYKVNKAWAISGTYYHYLENNMRQYDKSVFGLDLSYKVNSWLKAGIDYRFGINSKKQYHDIRYAVTAGVNLSPKWKIAYRPMLQQEFSSLKKEDLKGKPIEYYLRNRFTISYEPTNNWDLYIFSENYLEIEKPLLTFYRQKSALGTDYKINERNKIGFRFEVINKKNGKMVSRPNLSYTHTIGKVRKK